MKNILLAEDEQNLRKVLGAFLMRDGHAVTAKADGMAALDHLRAGNPADLVLTDLKMPHMDGMELLRHIQQDWPGIPVVIITAHGTVDLAVEAMKLGAFDFISKPFEQAELNAIVKKALKAGDYTAREPRISGGSDSALCRFGIIGQSPAMDPVYDAIQRVANTPSTVLISGESGTGKELVAKALHETSSRANRPFIKVHCAAIPQNLFESELFGYEKGAFTGAVTSKPGRFELADKGTLFLDEVGEIPPEMQVKLLRCLQEGEFERVGGIRTVKVEVRIITATNRDLSEEVKRGLFREDLYYRLNVIPIHLPPLRLRIEDISPLANHFITRFNSRLGRQVEGLSPSALAALQQYPWPGNIRELENLMERMILFCDHEHIQAEDLPDSMGLIGDGQGTLVGDIAPPPGPQIVEGLTPAPDGGSLLPSAESGLKDIVRETTSRLERVYITQALDQTGGNVTKAAQILKISRKSLQLKMKEFGLRET